MMKMLVVLLLSSTLLQGVYSAGCRVEDERVEALEKTVQDLTALVQDLLNSRDNHPMEPQLNATVEERLTLLELQVGDLDNDLDVVEDEIIFISSAQILQDQKILDLQVASNGFEETVEQLFGADVSLRQDLDSLNSTVDERLQAQEVAGTVAFKADLDEYDSLPFDSPAVFEVEELNIGGGYSPVTGEFTVPPGGGGLYFLYVNLVSDGENSSFYLRVNGQDFCRAQSYDPGSFNQISCGFTYILEDGDVVDVFYSSGTDDTPIADGSGSHNAFTGFRIAPQ